MSALRGLPRAVLIAMSVVVLAIVVTLIVARPWSPPGSGPLGDVGTSAMHVEYPLAAGQTATWGNVLPANPTSEDIAIEHIELVGVSGLTVLGMSVNDPASAGIGFTFGYPPSGVPAKVIEGSILPRAGAPSPHLQLLVGVKEPEAGGGEIEAIRVRYRYDGNSYEVTLPFSLRIVGSEQ